MSTPPIDQFVGGIPVIPDELVGDKDFAPNLFIKMADVGFQSVRFAFFWNYSDDPAYVRDYIDLVLNQAQLHKFRCYGMLLPPNHQISVGWTPPDIKPATKSAFLKLVKKLGKNHGAQIEYWEVLNEVNRSVLDETGKIIVEKWYEGTAYASLLRDTYRALLQGFREMDDDDYATLVKDRGEPPFKLYAAGTSGTDIAWIDAVCVGLEQLYSQHPTEGKYINGFSIHPFSNNVGPDEDFKAEAITEIEPLTTTKTSHGTLAANIDWAVATLKKHPDVPNDLFIGEYAWSTFAQGEETRKLIVTEQEQGIYVSQGFIEAHASGKLSQAIWAWTFIDLDGEWDYWDHTGALRTDRVTPKESYKAIKSVIGKLRGLKMSQNLSWMLPGNGRMFLYQGGKKTRLVYWSSDDTQIHVKFQSKTTIKTYDHLGTELSTADDTDSILVDTNAAPRFLEVRGPLVAAIQGVAFDKGVPVAPGSRRLLVDTSTARASNTQGKFVPARAFDTKANTWWNAGGFPTQWIEVAFPSPATVAGMMLIPIQLPAGLTEHEILFHINGSYKVVHRFNSHTAEGMKIVVNFPTPHRNVRKMKVQTTKSLSFVGWYEITAYAP